VQRTPRSRTPFLTRPDPGEDNRLLDYLPDQFSAGPDDERPTSVLAAPSRCLTTLKSREARVPLYFASRMATTP
jgi:hypothetical protein